MNIDAALKVLKERYPTFRGSTVMYSDLEAVIEALREPEELAKNAQSEKPECDGSFCRYCGPTKCTCDGHGNEIKAEKPKEELHGFYVPSKPSPEAKESVESMILQCANDWYLSKLSDHAFVAKIKGLFSDRREGVDYKAAWHKMHGYFVNDVNKHHMIDLMRNIESECKFNAQER